MAFALSALQSSRMRLIVTDGVFSMDGDVAPLRGICDLAEQYRALVFIDECHATGFLGRCGRWDGLSKSLFVCFILITQSTFFAVFFYSLFSFLK